MTAVSAPGCYNSYADCSTSAVIEIRPEVSTALPRGTHGAPNAAAVRSDLSHIAVFRRTLTDFSFLVAVNYPPYRHALIHVEISNLAIRRQCRQLEQLIE
jgi:hypothetical protein